ncbi:MAG TPA: sulfite exporter TauE/SafE family protein [Candidatus Acidoferrum sp.]|nr:sulfite exporter TauE/SafE family protein [Candidatus Acidoferrum sp.]
MHTFLILLLGLAAGILVGLTGIGGGSIIVPALVYLLGMDQHMAQGTSLFVLLPPLGLGALWRYWKKREVDFLAGAICAAGFFIGGYFGGRMAIGIPSRPLQAIFGGFLVLSSLLILRQSKGSASRNGSHA